jgi:hypothetical protein
VTSIGVPDVPGTHGSRVPVAERPADVETLGGELQLRTLPGCSAPWVAAPPYTRTSRPSP